MLVLRGKSPCAICDCPCNLPEFKSVMKTSGEPSNKFIVSEVSLYEACFVYLMVNPLGRPDGLSA